MRLEGETEGDPFGAGEIVCPIFDQGVDFSQGDESPCVYAVELPYSLFKCLGGGVAIAKCVAVGEQAGWRESADDPTADP